MDILETPVKGHKDPEGTGASLLRGKAEREMRLFSLKKAQGDLISVYSGCKEPVSAQWCPVTGPGAMGTD